MGLMTQKAMAQQGSERINEFLSKSKEDSIQKEFDEDAMQMADRQAEYESNQWKNDPSKQEAGLVSPIDSVLEFTGVGSAMEATRAVSSLVEGDWLGAALGMVAALPAGKKAKASLESSTGYVKQKKKIDGFDFWQSANPKANDVVRVPDSVTADISERVKRSFDSSTAATITPAPGKFWSPVKRVAVESPTGLPAGKTGKGKDATPRFVTVTDTDVAQPSYKKELQSMMTKAGITTDPDFGNYIMMGKNPKEVSGKTFENLFITPIGVTRNTTPIGARSPQPLARANPYSGEDMTIEQMRNNHKLNTGTTGTTYNTNLLQPTKFDIKTKSGLFDLDHPIVAVVDSNKHLYSLSTQFVGPATMVRKSVFGLAKGQYKVPQPNLRPATVGSASTGKQVGVIRIKSSGKEHPLYDYIEVDATASAPKDMGKIPKFNQGGLVDNEMQALNFNHGGVVHGKVGASNVGADMLAKLIAQNKQGDFKRGDARVAQPTPTQDDRPTPTQDDRPTPSYDDRPALDAAVIKMVEDHKRKQVVRAEEFSEPQQSFLNYKLSNLAEAGGDVLSEAVDSGIGIAKKVYRKGRDAYNNLTSEVDEEMARLQADTTPTKISQEAVPPIVTDHRGKAALERGVRNNNPLNIKKKVSNAWDGIAEDQSGDSIFATFESAEYGIRAALRTLVTYQNKHKLRTPSEMLARWAPPSENIVSDYVATVKDLSGLSMDDPMVIGNNQKTLDLIRSMVAMENSQKAMRGYSSNTYNRALQLAFPTPKIRDDEPLPKERKQDRTNYAEIIK